MKSGTRGLIVSLLVFSFWGTFLVGPFRYFAAGFFSVLSSVFGQTGLSAPLTGLILSVLLAGLTLLLLLLGSGKYAGYVAGTCALLSLVYELLRCISQRDFSSVALVVAIGLSLALLFLVFRFYRASLWLADAYIFAVPVLLFIHLVLSPLCALAPQYFEHIRAVWDVSVYGIGGQLGNLLGIPELVWGILLFALLMVPVHFLAKRRKKG